MSTPDFSMQTSMLLDAMCERLFPNLQAGEDVTVSLEAEETLYLRLNNNRVRQNTDVTQRVLQIRYQGGGRTIDHGLNLSGQVDADCRSIDAVLERCRLDAAVLPQDPFQVPMQNHGSSREVFTGQLLSVAALIPAIVEPAGACDLVGFYAGGVVIRANRNSKGQNHWFETENFFFDYSLYNGPQAVKSVYAASSWNARDWAANLERSKASLLLLKRPLQSVHPGAYRSYFAPAAFADLLGMMSWSALSAAAWKQGHSPFKKLIEKEVQLSPLLSVSENFGMGLTPRFNDLGEVAPQSLDLIEAGSLRNLLVSSRSAKEYGLQANGASGNESPRALDVAAGTLGEQEVLSALNKGLYLSNLHYLNWSDPVSARVTGMTRYACFWVEGGEIIGPINNLRWDESLYNALGPQLMALGSQAEISPEVGTYSKRSPGGMRAPGALIDAFQFTL
jgi:predicted Zn-dependent protease